MLTCHVLGLVATRVTADDKSFQIEKAFDAPLLRNADASVGPMVLTDGVIPQVDVLLAGVRARSLVE